MSTKENKQTESKKEKSNEIDVNKDFDKREKSNGGYDHPPQGKEG